MKILPPPPYDGACLCGRTTVRLTELPLLTVACHCRDCHKLTASAFSMTTMFASRAFTYTGDLIRGGKKSRERAHYYCQNCLTFIYSQVKGAEVRINLRTSLLDRAEDFHPYAEVMTASRRAWVTLSVAHSFPQGPATAEDLQNVMASYAAACHPKPT